MSGRAGRRGKDDRGIVIQMLDEKMDPQVAKGKYDQMACDTSVDSKITREPCRPQTSSKSIITMWLRFVI